MCSVPVVGPWEAGGVFTVPGPEGSCVGEAKEQWPNALMSITAVCVRSSRAARQCAPNSIPTLGKAQGPKVRL